MTRLVQAFFFPRGTPVKFPWFHRDLSQKKCTRFSGILAWLYRVCPADLHLHLTGTPRWPNVSATRSRQDVAYSTGRPAG